MKATVRVERVRMHMAAKGLIHISVSGPSGYETLGVIEYNPLEEGSYEPVIFPDSGPQESELVSSLDPHTVHSLLSSIGTDVFYYDADFIEVSTPEISAPVEGAVLDMTI